MMKKRNNNSESIIKLKWEDAIKEIKLQGLEDKCSNLIQAANTSASVLGDKAEVILAKYKFGSYIIKEKKFFLPDGNEHEKYGLINDVVPICLVLDRQAEVYLNHKHTDSNKTIDLPRSLRLLQPGDLFGVFEVADRLTGLDFNREDWWVTAGVRTARLLYPMNNINVQQYLRDEIQPIDCAKDALTYGVNCLEDWTWHIMLGLSHKINTNWFTNIMIFPDQWFTVPSGLKFQCEIFKASWNQVRIDNIRNLRRISISDSCEDPSSDIFQLLQHKNIRGYDGKQLLTLLDDVANGRSLVHIPSFPDKDGCCPGGPFGKIIEMIEHRLVKERRDAKNSILPIVLVPHYLSPNNSGYVSLSRPVSFEFNFENDRVTDFLTAAGAQIRKYKPALELLIPRLDWDNLCFYGRFNKICAKCKKAKDLSDVIPQVHTNNKFFLHSIFVKRKE